MTNEELKKYINEEELEEGFLDNAMSKAKKFATTAALGGALALGLGGSAQAANYKDLSANAKPIADVSQSIFKDAKMRKAFESYLAKHKEDKAGAAMKFIAHYGEGAGKTAVRAAGGISEAELFKAISVGLSGIESGGGSSEVSKTQGATKSTRRVEDMGGGKYKVYGSSSHELARAQLLKKAGKKSITRLQSGSDEGGSYHLFQIKENKMKITKNMLAEMVKKELQQEISKEKLRALGLAGGLAAAGAAGYGIGKAAGPYVDKMLAQEPYSVTSHTPPAEYGSADYPAGGDVMPVEVSDAMDKFAGRPEFSDSMSLRAAIDSVAMARKPLTYEAVKAEYDSIVSEPGAMRENKIKVSASKLDAMINEELKRVMKK